MLLGLNCVYKKRKGLKVVDYYNIVLVCKDCGGLCCVNSILPFKEKLVEFQEFFRLCCLCWYSKVSRSSKEPSLCRFCRYGREDEGK